MRTRNRSFEESFWVRVNRLSDQECWVWKGSKYPAGYGFFSHKEYSKVIRATHASLFILTGQWPTYVMHLCDNPPCVNPAHLRQATHKENMEDKVAKGRLRNQYKNRTHCSKGHEYIEGSYWFRKGTTYRICKECHNAPRRKS